MCRFVPILLLLAACADHHAVDPRTDGGTPRVDAPDRADAPAFVDVPVFGDAGPDSPDGMFPDTCRPEQPQFYCLDRPYAPADEPFTLRLAYAGCFCEETARCEVSGIGSGLIQLRTSLCGSPALCGECVPEVELECELPALPPADYEIRIHGESVGLLPVYPPVPGPTVEGPRCTSFAVVDGCTGGRVFESTRDRFHRMCVEQEGDREWLRLVDDCAECPAYHGLCDARVEPRLDRFFPPGADIHLDPRIYYGACDGACDDSCHHDERRCPLPALRPGDFYRVLVDGELVMSFTGGETSSCDEFEDH